MHLKECLDVLKKEVEEKRGEKCQVHDTFSMFLVPIVEQARGIFYTTQDTLLLTCRGEGSLLVVEEKREADDHIVHGGHSIYT